MVNFYSRNQLKTIYNMDTLQNIWENYTSYTQEFNFVQKAIISAVLSFIILASLSALVLLFIETFG